MQWTLISKLQLFDKDGVKNGVKLAFRKGRDQLIWVVDEDSKKWQVGFAYEQNITLKLLAGDKRNIQDTLDIHIEDGK